VKTRGLALDASRLPTDAELARLIVESKDRLVRTLVPFLAETGLSISEALFIRQSDIVRAKGFYRSTIRGKANKEREILLATWLHDRLRTTFRGEIFLFEHSGKPYSRIACTDGIRRETQAVLGRGLNVHRKKP
jgi:integrase